MKTSHSINGKHAIETRSSNRSSIHAFRRNATRLAFIALMLAGIAPVAMGEINLPQPQGMVSDFAGKLTPATRDSLENLATNFRDRSGGIEIAIVTVPHEWLGGYTIEEYGLQIGRQWGVGRSSDKAGLVLLVAIKPPNADGTYSGNTRIEVSRHLEGDVPDGLAGEINSRMRNDFRAGNFDKALTIGAQTILATIAQARGISMEGIDQRMAYSQKSRPRRSRGINPLAIVAVIAVVFFILSAIGRGRGGPRGGGRRRYGSDWMIWPIIFGGGGPGGFGGHRGGSDWGGGFGGGDGGGFGGFGGGGDFGGGGASDSW